MSRLIISLKRELPESHPFGTRPQPVEIAECRRRDDWVDLVVMGPYLDYSGKGPVWNYAYFALRNIPVRGDQISWEEWATGTNEPLHSKVVLHWRQGELLPKNLPSKTLGEAVTPAEADELNDRIDDLQHITKQLTEHQLQLLDASRRLSQDLGDRLLRLRALVIEDFDRFGTVIESLTSEPIQAVDALTECLERRHRQLHGRPTP